MKGVLVGVSILLAGAVVAWGVFELADGGAREGDAEQRTVDEEAGTFRGVGIGSSTKEVRAELGPSAAPVRAYPIEPLGSDRSGAGGPYSVVTGPHQLGPGPPPDSVQVTLRYESASFFVFRDEVFGLMVTQDGASTQRGIGIGDGVSAVRDAYPSLRCEPAFRGETTAVQAKHCSGRLRVHRYIYFGGDPIQSITMMNRDFDAPILCPTVDGHPERLPGVDIDC